MCCVAGIDTIINITRTTINVQIIILFRFVFFLRNGIIFPRLFILLYSIKTGDENASGRNNNQRRGNYCQQWRYNPGRPQRIKHVYQKIYRKACDYSNAKFYAKTVIAALARLGKRNP